MRSGISTLADSPLDQGIQGRSRQFINHRVRKVKFSTKIVGLANFEREAVDRIETSLKVKLKSALFFFLKVKGNEHNRILFS